VEEELKGEGWRSSDAHKFASPLYQLVINDSFWRDRNKGLAVFHSQDLSHQFRLPISFTPQVFVGSRFVTRPLLPLVHQDDRFLLLTLSQHRVRLFSGDRSHLTFLPVAGMPTKLDETVVATDQGHKQMHTGDVDMRRRHATIYHGHGGKVDTRKSEIFSFLRSVDRSLHETLRHEQSPLIVAGVVSMISIYREINTYPRLACQDIEISCDRSTEAELHRLAWPIMEDILANNRKLAIEREYARAERAQWIRDYRKIIPAAEQGHVEMLLVASDASLYGTYTPSLNGSAVRLDERHQDDLADVAAANTIKHHGKVIVLDREEIPGCCDLAAVLRK
jgi:hypothetical protein